MRASCDTILTDADTGSGLVVKEGLTNAPSLAKSTGEKRQGAGVGDACNAILTDGDTGSGLAVKEAGQNYASLVSSVCGKNSHRQLDKVGAGTAAVISLASPDAAVFQEDLTNNIDGYGTGNSAIIGQQVGALEPEAGESARNLVPSKVGRQLDKACAGTVAVISLADPDAATYQEDLTNNIDVGTFEAEAGTGAGNLVQSKLPAH